MPQNLGCLKAVEVRSQWGDEAADFTPWLASREGISLLSGTLDMDLEVEGTEVAVGPYSADIVALDASSNARVVIENQFEKTDHDHLGKAITYASGLGANVIIWIAESFTEEHRRALDFLNENATTKLRFFGLEVQLWRIGDSPPAPMFKVASSPNDYLALVKTEEQDLSETQILYQTFWTAFKEYCRKKGSSLRLRKPLAQSWMSLAVGRANFSISLTASKQKERIGCELYIQGPTAKRAFELLYIQKTEIEATIGPLDWQDLPDKIDCRVVVYKDGVTVEIQEEWDQAFNWLRERAELFTKVFSGRVQSLDLEDTGSQGAAT